MTCQDTLPGCNILQIKCKPIFNIATAGRIQKDSIWNDQNYPPDR